MNPEEFVYKTTYTGALKAGVRETQAKNAAVIALEKYKKGRFKKASDLIRDEIASAKKRC